MVVYLIDTAPHGVETPTWGSQSVELAPPGDDMILSPEQRSFHSSTNFNKPGTKTVVPLIYTAPHGVDTSTWGSSFHRATATRGRWGPIPG